MTGDSISRKSIDFRINWGYQYLYSSKHYHPIYFWNGNLSCTNGEIKAIYQLAYPYLQFGPGQSPKEVRLKEARWNSSTQCEYSGIRVEAEVEEDSIFCLKTESGIFSFRTDELIKNKRIEFSVGPKYLGCVITVTVSGHLWFRTPSDQKEVVWEADELNLPVHDWARMRLAWLAPGEKVVFNVNIAESAADTLEALIHIVAMGVPEYNAEKESQVRGRIPFTLYCDDEVILEFSRFYRHHDMYLQLLEDQWIRAKVGPGMHRFALKNEHKEMSLGICRITVASCEYRHGQLSVPKWALIGEEIWGKVFAARRGYIDIDGYGIVECDPGWNEFALKAIVNGNIELSTESDKALVEVFDCEEEKNPIKVGYDMTFIPHDNSGYMEWLLEHTYYSRMGNYVIFRNYTGTIQPDQLRKWAEYCKKHSMYTAFFTNFISDKLVLPIKELFDEGGSHEHSGIVYYGKPERPLASEDMLEATQKFINYLRKEIEKTRAVCDRVVFGDASGGIRYSYLAGIDYVRAETMCGHTMPLLSHARASADALGDGRWGIHIASQHCYSPYNEKHMGQYFLALMQPWMMGAETINEEDSLFCLITEERQTWDDFLTREKRNMTRNFFKFAKTHPRRGKCVRSIAFLEGRYAAPFNGFTCGEQDSHDSIWGSFGSQTPEWGHKQPEKCRQILDVLMPGASTVPLRQKFDKRRFYFSGTPYGDFDCVPVEADQNYMKQYKLMLNLGWNTMVEEDYVKLKAYVESGGVLLTGLPQFSTHVKRDFLRNMEDLALWNDGDLREMCGIIVEGKGECYLGQWNCSGRDAMEVPELSGMPNDDVNEDGKAHLAEVRLCGAEIVAWDAATGKPMLVKNQVGKGMVYIFTIWAYPGHEQFQTFCAAWVREMAGRSLPNVYVEDPTKEVFWTRWIDGEKQILMLLNTDWTEKHNEKEVLLVADGQKQKVKVKERTALIAEIGNGEIQATEYTI